MFIKKLTQTTPLFLAVSCAVSDTSDIKGGRETGGVPPMVESTFVRFSGGFDDNVLESSDWQAFQEVIAEADLEKVCTNAVLEDSRGRLTLKVVGMIPKNFMEKFGRMGHELSPKTSIGAASHYGICGSFKTIQAKEKEQESLWNIVRTFGDQISGIRSSYKAKAMTCGRDIDERVSCVLQNNKTWISIRNDDAIALHRYLASKMGIQTLARDQFYLTNISCNNMELTSPGGFTTRTICSFDTPTNWHLGFEKIKTELVDHGAQIRFSGENVDRLKAAANNSESISCDEISCSVLIGKGLTIGHQNGLGRYDAENNIVYLRGEAAQFLYDQLFDNNDITIPRAKGDLRCIGYARLALPWHDNEAKCWLRL